MKAKEFNNYKFKNKKLKKVKYKHYNYKNKTIELKYKFKDKNKICSPISNHLLIVKHPRKEKKKLVTVELSNQA